MVKLVCPLRLKTYIRKQENFSPDQLLKCQWQKEKNASLMYLLYRWLVSIVFVIILMLSVFNIGRAKKNLEVPYTNKWPIYLTNWGFLLCTTQAIIGAIIVTNYYKKSKKIEGSNGQILEVMMSKSLKVYWILNSSALVIALGITFVYWTAVYNPKEEELDAINVLVHAFNSVLMMIDLFIVAYPIMMRHCIFPACFIIIYTIFNFSYFLAGGTDNKGRIYIYKVMDWRFPLRCMAFFFGGLALLLFLHFIIWIIAVQRKKFYFCLLKEKPVQDYDADNIFFDLENKKLSNENGLSVI